jgi:hypothetical protein
MKVWNHTTGQVEVFQTSKKVIKSQILNLARDPDYGALSGYDLKIKRTGDKMETVYTVIPTPPKPLDQEIQEKADDTYVNIEALFEGKNPFEKSQSESIEESLDDIFPPK